MVPEAAVALLCLRFGLAGSLVELPLAMLRKLTAQEGRKSRKASWKRFQRKRERENKERERESWKMLEQFETAPPFGLRGVVSH